MIVMKFGGTSVQDKAAVRRVIEIVGRETRPRLVVVSALSKVTDGLLEIARLAEQRDAVAAGKAVRALQVRHVELAGVVGAAELRATLLKELDATFAELAAMVGALGVVGEVSARSRDTIVATGEVASSRILAAALEDAGQPSRWLDPRELLVTDGTHGAALPDRAATDARLRANVQPQLEAGRVGVTGGFVGASAEGLTTTLGRGGSDYSAALFGAGLAAQEIQIWTDVDGMLTADPRVVEAPRVVSRLSFDEASELAYFGAKVLHPSTILPAVERNIPVRILNSWRPDGAGTLITAQSETQGTRLTGLASKKDVTVIDITSTRMLMAYGFLRRVFEVFERFRTAVDMVTTSEVSVSVTVDDRRNLDAIVQALSEFSEVSIEGDLALLCAVGDSLQGAPEIAARVVGVLEEVPLKMISQAASRRNITVVLRQSDLPHAMQRLHEEFFA